MIDELSDPEIKKNLFTINIRVIGGKQIHPAFIFILFKSVIASIIVFILHYVLKLGRVGQLYDVIALF